MTKQQKQAVQNAINKCRFPVHWVDQKKHGQIDVPSDMVHTDCMFASYLVNSFDFRVASVIPGSVDVKPLFNPEMTDRIIEKVESNDFLIPGRDYKITYLRNSDKPYSYVMTFVKQSGIYYEWISRSREIAIKKEEFERLINNGEVEKV